VEELRRCAFLGLETHRFNEVFGNRLRTVSAFQPQRCQVDDCFNIFGIKSAL
jgi:hypothetical protein